MEFNFNVNLIFKNRITKFDGTSSHHFKTPRRNQTQPEDSTCIVIDKLGCASAKAQGLRIPVTSSTKMLNTSNIIYLLKDELNRANGAAIGFLKIGFKTLFVYDKDQAIHELDPMCVLDFYIHESRQRQGFGKELFDYMLKDTGLQPCQLAIDRPSFKFTSFLKKHYNLVSSIPQSNNFVIYHGFFGDKKTFKSDKTKGESPASKVPQITLSQLKLHEGEGPLKGESSALPEPVTKKIPVQNVQQFGDKKVLPSIPTSQHPIEVKDFTKERRPSPVCSPDFSRFTPTYRGTAPRERMPPCERMPPLPLGMAGHYAAAGGYLRHRTTQNLPQQQQHTGNHSSGNITGENHTASTQKDTHNYHHQQHHHHQHLQNASPLVPDGPDSVSTKGFTPPSSAQHASLHHCIDPSNIRLPEIKSQKAMNFQPKSEVPDEQISNNGSSTNNTVPWSLFNNASKYHSFLKRGYSHTRIW
ncbi:alpha-tubulin N-acetyltransferase 1-like isoform X2 [Argonauta hians]